MQDQVVFITGPARGIGEHVARVLAERGARLALAGLEPDRLEALARELGPRHSWFACDVTDAEGLRRAAAHAVEHHGGIDVVVANAGIAAHGTVAVTPAEVMARVVEVNLTGVINTVSATLAHVVARKGYILLVSSAAAIATSPGLAAYAGAKSGVEHFGNALRAEVAHKGVAVGVAHPCWIETDMVRDASDMESFRRMLKALPGPFGKVTPVQDCAAAIVDAIDRRRRKVYVPRSLAPYALLRQLFMSAPFEALQRRSTGRLLARMEEEVTTSGQYWGKTSVEAKR